MTEIRKVMPTQTESNPQDFMQQVSSHRRKCQVRTLWIETLGTYNNASQRDLLMEKSVCRKSGTVANQLALKILFPEKSMNALQKIMEMPAATLEERIRKESAFRSLLLSHYQFKEIQDGNNCGLRAILSCLNPEVDPKTEEMTAHIIRGDVIQHIKNNPELLEQTAMDAQEYVKTMASGAFPIGEMEIHAMSCILQCPIYIFSYEGIHIGTNHEIIPTDQRIFGENYAQPPICIYFDPIRSHYSAMRKLSER